MSEFPPATVAKRRRASGQRLIKVANSLPVYEYELIELSDKQFLTAKELESISKIMKNLEAIRIAMTRMGARLAATE